MRWPLLQVSEQCEVTDTACAEGRSGEDENPLESLSSRKTSLANEELGNTERSVQVSCFCLLCCPSHPENALYLATTCK